MWSRLTREPGVLRLRNGLRYWIRPQASDRASITEILMLSPYSLPPNGSVVVDIGANIGAWSIPASRLAKVVYAVEPIAGNFDMLARNCELNEAANVIPIQLAISHTSGPAEMSVNGVMSSLVWCQPGKEMESVTTLSLDRLLDQYRIERVDFLKMDCEGAEWEILLNAPASLFERIGRMELEYHVVKGMQPKLLLDRLEGVGFRTSVSGDCSTGIIKAARPPGAGGV